MFFDSGKIINEPEDKNDGKPPFILSYKLSISLSPSHASHNVSIYRSRLIK